MRLDHAARAYADVLAFIFLTDSRDTVISACFTNIKTTVETSHPLVHYLVIFTSLRLILSKILGFFLKAFPLLRSALLPFADGFPPPLPFAMSFSYCRYCVAEAGFEPTTSSL